MAARGQFGPARLFARRTHTSAVVSNLCRWTPNRKPRQRRTTEDRLAQRVFRCRRGWRIELALGAVRIRKTIENIKRLSLSCDVNGFDCGTSKRLIALTIRRLAWLISSWGLGSRDVKTDGAFSSDNRSRRTLSVPDEVPTGTPTAPRVVRGQCARSRCRQTPLSDSTGRRLRARCSEPPRGRPPR
jgi:hypothetical protein